jgi:flagellin-like protein
MNEKDLRTRLRHRRARLQKEARAVSPVVATLILILVAVAAAAALYLWLVTFQNGVQNQTGNPNVNPTITIGGSSTVYPFSAAALPWFQQNYSNIGVSITKGGSGAGVTALCAGAINLAEASRPIATTDCAANPLVLPKLVATEVAIDAAVPIVSQSNAGGWTSTASVGIGEYLEIYWQNGGQPSCSVGFPFAMSQMNTVGCTLQTPTTTLTSPGFYGLMSPGVGDTQPFTWADVPETYCYDPAIVAHGATLDANGYLTAPPTSGPCHGLTYSASTNPIHVWARADNSGTEFSFDSSVLGLGVSNTPYCSPDGQLASCGFDAPAGGVSVSSATTGQINTGVGNPTLLSDIAKDPNGMGFNSYGIAKSNPTSAVTFLGFQGNGQTTAVFPSVGTIKAGSPEGFNAKTFTDSAFAGWRPLNYITIGAPTGEVAQWINFVTQPGVDTTLCGLASVNYISPYT